MLELLPFRDQVDDLADDLRERVELRDEYAGANEKIPYETWLDDVLDRAAVAWVFGGVLVRFCENNRLVRERWAEWPGGRLRAGFERLARLPATARLFDETNPVWRFDLSARATARLADFLRRCPMPADPRLLGDLYQGLSRHARRTYALLQTPEFVEDLILDRTFEPAVREFGLAATRVVDPACGAGHFLVGAFDRLLRRWRDAEPETDVRVLVRRALDQVTGVDINPFAVAIAHFRLTVAVLTAYGIRDLDLAPDLRIRLATGDALLAEEPYLRPGQYTVVVGNPPYITVKDRDRDRQYRRLYPACSRKYALTVPFCQLFFRLARRGGHVGQITANSFMRREFGRKLVTGFLATEVELTEVIDTSGAYLPGHGTPTVILIGRNRPVDRRSPPIRAVLGVRGEPGCPADPAKGKVWSAILDQIDRPGESPWVTVVDASRERLARHPWTLSGGAAERLMAALEAHPARLRDHTARIGVFGMTNADDVLLADRRTWLRRVGRLSMNRRLVVGDELRDWVCEDGVWAFFPYDEKLRLTELDPAYLGWLWPARTVLGNRVTFRRRTYFAEGRPWHAWHQVTADPSAHPWWITYAFVATHNHFVLDRGGNVFKQSAPVVKLPAGATEEDHLALLGVLNSSAACFWLKQVCHNKGSTVDRSGARQTTVAWENFYEFGGTKLRRLPLPPHAPVELARRLDELARRLAAAKPSVDRPTARAEWESVRHAMIATQEELDWAVYRDYGLAGTELTTDGPVPPVRLGERAFEIVLARRGETQWFARHGSAPVTSPPADWPVGYRALVERRIAAIESDALIGLVERPEYKRRWSGPDWPARQDEALREWLLDRLETDGIWDPAPFPLSLAQLAERVDDDFRAVLDRWGGDLRRLVTGEHVPFLAALRFTAAGRRKRAQWERTWQLQRRADAGEPVDIPVPPRYRAADYRRVSYWRLRGRLDVPHERFISYPGGELGLAGWDHLDRARALIALYRARRDRPAATVLPLLAGLAELEPWLAQWHAAAAPEVTALIDAELARLGADRAALY